MSVVALVIAPSIALDVDEVTAHNMKAINVTEQVMVSETAEETLVTEETALTVNSEEIIDATVKTDETTNTENKEQE